MDNNLEDVNPAFSDNITNKSSNCVGPMPSCTYENVIDDESAEEMPQSPFTTLIETLASIQDVLSRNQQRDEQDISKDEKVKILTDIFEKSKSSFLFRFGQFLSPEQAKLFEQFQSDPKNGYEVKFHLKNVSQMHSDRRRHKHLRNRRYAALKRLVEKDSYFSEIEMMRRNPLLYEQLVGRYLSVTEKKIRDYKSSRPNTFVGVLLNGIEKDQAEAKRKQQEAAEDAAMEEDDEEEEDSDSSDEESYTFKPSGRKAQQSKKISRTFWGEIQEDLPAKIKLPMRDSELSITAQERKLLKEEFVSSMYQSFLDGKDDDFDYDSVDNNDEYDNLEILAHDEEEKYFDSEEPDDTTMEDDANSKAKEESSEDELDIYMNALNQHPVVCQLSEDLMKL